MSSTRLGPIEPHHPPAEDLHPARSLREAAEADNTLQGYVAMNEVDPDSEIAHYALETPINLHEQIADLAYHIYLERGGGDGYAQSDWLEAERIVKSRLKPNR